MPTERRDDNYVAAIQAPAPLGHGNRDGRNISTTATCPPLCCAQHNGGIDADEPLPEFLRRERFLDMTAGVVASSGHPLLGAKVTRRDLSRFPWIDFDWPATASPGDGRPSLDALLEGLGETVPARVRTVLRAGTAGLHVMADGPYLAWLSLTFLDRLPGGFLRPLPVRFGRYRYRSGFVARRSAEDLAPLRRLEAIVREIALGQRG